MRSRSSSRAGTTRCERAGLKIMALQAAARKTPDARRKELFELYLRRTDRIDNWDLVDVAAADVVGRYLVGRPRKVLYKLARSRDPWERRTAIVSTLFFVRQREVDDTFRIAELLVSDDHDLVQKATGGLLEGGREAGWRSAVGLSRQAFRDDEPHGSTLRDGTPGREAPGQLPSDRSRSWGPHSSKASGRNPMTTSRDDTRGVPVPAGRLVVCEKDSGFDQTSGSLY